MAHENTAATPRVDPALRVPLLTAVVGMVAAAAFGFVLPSMLAVPVAVLVMGLAVLSALVALDMHRRLQADALARNVGELNVRNALGTDTLIPINAQYDGTVASYRVPPERRIYLTNTFSF